MLSQHACMLLLQYVLYSGTAPPSAERLLEASRSGAFRRRVGWCGVMSALLLCGDDGSLCLQAATLPAVDTEAVAASHATGGGGKEWPEVRCSTAAAAALFAVLRAAGVTFERRLSHASCLLSSLSDAQVLLAAVHCCRSLLPLPQPTSVWNVMRSKVAPSID